MSQNVIAQIHELLAAKRYSVADTGETGLKITDVDSGLTVFGELQGEILFFSLVCATVEEAKVTPTVMAKMLAAANGINTSHFQLHSHGDGEVSITLSNFCKLQEIGPDDEDDILSCVGFLLADVIHARDLLAADLA
jgi:hypothetical protein